MMDRIQAYFLENIGEKRWNHSLRVLDTALELARIYGGDQDRVHQAALLHDCGKIRDKSLLLKKAKSFGIILDEIMLRNQELIHGPLGAKIAEVEFQVKDPEVLDAIRYHTTARPAMTKLEKIIFLGDIIEADRNFPGVEDIRKLAYEDLDEAIILALDGTLEFLVRKKDLIAKETVEARNYLKIEKQAREE